MRLVVLRDYTVCICIYRLQGDLIYVPSHWWHHVETTFNAPAAGKSGGYSVGVNSFFEPYYHRRGFQSKLNVFQFNRYYWHLAGSMPYGDNSTGADLAALCEGDFVCFHRAKALAMGRKRKKSAKTGKYRKDKKKSKSSKKSKSKRNVRDL